MDANKSSEIKIDFNSLLDEYFLEDVDLVNKIKAIFKAFQSYIDRMDHFIKNGKLDLYLETKLSAKNYLEAEEQKLFKKSFTESDKTALKHIFKEIYLILSLMDHFQELN